MMPLAADIPDEAAAHLIGYAVNGLMTVGLMVFGWLAKRALSGLEDTVNRSATRIESVVTTMQAQATALALHDQWKDGAHSEIVELRRKAHDMISTVTALKGEMGFLKESVDSLQDQISALRGDSGRHRMPREPR